MVYDEERLKEDIPLVGLLKKLFLIILLPAMVIFLIFIIPIIIEIYNSNPELFFDLFISLIPVLFLLFFLVLLVSMLFRY